MKVMVKKGGHVIRCRDTETGKNLLMERNFRGNIDYLSHENRLEAMKSVEKDSLEKFKEITKYRNYGDDYYREYLRMWPMIASSLNVETKMSDMLDQDIFEGGFIAGELNVVTGISGGGKTAFCSMLTACLISGNNPFLSSGTSFSKKKVIYVSLEQRKEQIEARIISTLTALNDPDKVVDYSEIISGKVKCIDWLNLGIDLYMFYKDNLKIIDYRAFGREPNVYKVIEKLFFELASYEDETPLVIIDRYENITGAESNTNSDVAKELKYFAEQTMVPVVLQAQMNKSAIASSRNTDGSYDYRKLSGNSLKGTSGLEHQASTVIILVPEEETGTFHGKSIRLMRVVVPKNRYGLLTNGQIWFAGGSNLFFDLDKKRGKKPKGANSEEDKGENNNQKQT